MITHSLPYSSKQAVDADAENLMRNGYRLVQSSSVTAYEYHVQGPHGINQSQMGGETIWTLYWAHPENQPLGCHYPSCA